MEAKDTVMTSGEIVKRLGNGDNSLQIAKVQAEISFKAGQEEETKGGHNAISYLEGIEEGKSLGIREVVELLKKQGAVWVDKNYAIIEAIERMGVDKPKK